MWTTFNKTINNSFQGPVEYVPVAFDNTSLTAQKELILHHGRGTLFVMPEALYNADGYLQDQSGIFQIIDENTCKYEFSGNLEAGKYLFIFKFLYL
jgi:hypothetical protein